MNYYRRSIPIIIFSTILAFFLMIFLGLLFPPLVLVVLAFFIAEIVMIQKYYQRKFERLTVDFLHSCEVHAYLQKLLPLANGNRATLVQANIQNKLASAYLYSGKYQEADFCMQQATGYIHGLLPQQGAAQIGEYYLIRATLDGILNRYPSAWNQLGKARELASRQDLNFKAIFQLREDCAFTEQVLHLYEGHSAGLEDFFQAQADRASNRFSVVKCHFYLGKAAMMNGNPARAVPSLQYVVQNGGNCNFVGMAQGLLEEAAATRT